MASKLNHRFIARIVLEAKTPLFVGSGESSLLKDALVIKDHGGLPIIPGTTLSGVLRHTLEESDGDSTWADIFGYQRNSEGLGSRVRISSAYFLLGNHKVLERFSEQADRYLLLRMNNLPSRQHVRINEKGVAVKFGLFDNEVVYNGARFVFEIELKGSSEDLPLWERMIREFSSPLFRIGQGTRQGYGKLGVLQLYQRIFNLEMKNEFDDYLNFDSSFNSTLSMEPPRESDIKSNIIHYKLVLIPEDFFVFSKGFGNDEVDNMPITEDVIVYDNNTTSFIEHTVIPASSIKGAMAHRVCFHYNRLIGNFADYNTGVTGIDNDAVYHLFGAESGGVLRAGLRGKVIIDDLYFTEAQINNSKVLNHVAIDRFTGGAMDGHLFSEKVSFNNRSPITLNIYVEQFNLLPGDNILKALELAMTDVCKGLLPLGGMTTKGYGMFTGTLLKDDVKIFEYNEKFTI